MDAIACNLITDSCCDLSQEFVERNNIRVLNFTYAEPDGNADGLAGVDDLFESMTAHEFYDAMRMGAQPMTSQPSPAVFEQAFREAIASGIPSVYISLSSGISGCYEGALSVLERLKEELGPDLPIYVVDSKMGSTAQALLVAEAVRQRDKGLTAEEMVRWLEEARYYVQIIFMVDDLKALRRGGRIPAGVAVAGSVLDVKPLLTFDLDGKLAMTGVARGRKKAMRKIADFYRKNHGAATYENVSSLGNADCPHDLKHLRDLLLKEDDSLMFLETNIGPTIGCHVGPGMLSCCFWGGDRRGSAPVADRIARDVRGA